jgi:hypothetical protein
MFSAFQMSSRSRRTLFPESRLFSGRFRYFPDDLENFQSRAENDFHHTDHPNGEKVTSPAFTDSQPCFEQIPSRLYVWLRHFVNRFWYCERRANFTSNSLPGIKEFSSLVEKQYTAVLFFRMTGKQLQCTGAASSHASPNAV